MKINKLLLAAIVCGSLNSALGQESKVEDAASRHGSLPLRLVVNITVDQLRSDFLDAFSQWYTDGGFNRLMSEGTVYGSASYPFAPVDRASAIATVATGVSPYYNGIVGQRWLQRETLRPVWCVDDERYIGLQTKETASPEALGSSTLGDELKVVTKGQALVWAVAPYSDAAILSAGHAADGALWIDDERGVWCSSQYYMQAMPGWVTDSPIQINGNDGQAQKKSSKKKEQRYKAFKNSAEVNTEVTSMALQCLSATGMGMDDVPDLLCVTYYAGVAEMTENYMIQNSYVRLDAEIGRLVEMVEKSVGRDHVLFVLTSTGYSEPSDNKSNGAEADYQKYRIPTGTFYMSRTADLLNMYLGAIWGPGKYVETTFRNHIFLSHSLLDAKKISMSEATGRAQELLVMMQGVRNVYTSLQLLTISNEQIQLVRSGYHPERCGDLVVETAPGWRVLTENTGESEYLRASFFQFPIIFYGANVGAMRVSQHVTTDRIAPTLARILRVRAPNACSAEPLF